ncbi:DUF4435 domain-containing protein [Abyssisolibacter fermentans]|uniref:DUF4435 domain-containing protein n=1 Tax=Abyssisolibacter fermentans TaxID=1766203 RepID=UPI00082D1304|nr:DUF4435 domain-containing protein [Abyssisolibacter fermentans]
MQNERTTAAKYSKHNFLSNDNDLIFFVEDTNIASRKLYSEILSTVFSDISMDNIYPLGNRIEVVKQCKKKQNLDDTRREIYIIDGDLYLLSGEDNTIFADIEELDKLFTLPRYCIENFLISENSLIDILDEEDTVKHRDDIMSKLNYSEWKIKNNELFKKLYIEYAICKKEIKYIPTIGYGINKLVSCGEGELDPKKVDDRIRDLQKQIISKIGNDRYKNARKFVEESIRYEDEFMLYYVSAKDHLLPLLYPRLNGITKLNCPKDTYLIKFAKRLDKEKLNDLLEFVSKLYPETVNSIA